MIDKPTQRPGRELPNSQSSHVTEGKVAWSGLMLQGIALTVLVLLIALGVRQSEGHWVYTLDDAYIHLAMARNVVEQGVWGVSPNVFMSCSSAPFWTLLLAGVFKVTGIRDWLPGLLNILSVLLVLGSIDRSLKKRSVTPVWRLVAGLTILFCAPLTVLASTGMEHCLHVLLVILFLKSALDELEAGGAAGRRNRAFLCAWAFLATATRFESLFIVFPVAAILFVKHRWRVSGWLVGTAILPVVLHGAYSLANGGFFLPNSLMLKGRFPIGDLGQIVFQLFSMYTKVSLENVHVHILCLLLLATACCRSVSQPLRLLALGFVSACFIQVTISECGRFYRYEAYLMVSGFLLLALAWLPADRLTNAARRAAELTQSDGWLLAARASLLCMLVLPLVMRGVWATSRVIRASTNIYEQQWQVARIFGTLDLTGTRVAINDLGLMAYHSGAELVDLWGLGTIEVARLKRAKAYDAAAVEALLLRQHVGYVAVYDQWFARGKELPESLILVAKLRNRQNIVCLQDTVMLYARGQNEAQRLRNHLKNLPFSLPRGTSIEFCNE